MGARGHGLGDVAGIANAAVGDDRHAVPPTPCRLVIAVICGTPTPEITRVVQIDPGPMPTLTASAPACDQGPRPSAVATLPAITSISIAPLDALHRLDHVARVAVGRVHHQDIDARLDQRFGPLVIVDANRRPDPQPAPFVLARVGEVRELVDVLDGDQTLQFIVIVHQQQFLDLIFRQNPLRRFERCIFRRP